jgi:hypothetical protein
LSIEGPSISEFDFREASKTGIAKEERHSFNAMYVKESKKVANQPKSTCKENENATVQDSVGHEPE